MNLTPSCGSGHAVRSLCTVGIAATCVLACNDATSAQTITNLGAHPTSGQPVRPSSVNDDGSVIAGWVHDGVALHAIRWTSAGGMQDLGVAPGATHSFGNGVSGDGLTIVGDEHGGANGGGAFLWTSAGGLQGLGTFGFNTAIITGVSGDGATVIGYGQAADGSLHSFLWTSAGGTQYLDSLNLFGDNGATSVNQDGTAIVGNYAGSQAFVWTSAAGMQGLGVLPTRLGAVANDVSGDGTTAVGYSYTWSGSTGYTFLDAFRWTAAGGMEDLGVLPGDDFSYATGVSRDGSVVVGTSYTLVGGYTAHPFLWTSTLGMVDLTTYLTALGVDLTGWNLGDAQGISADGSALFGYGSQSGATTGGWIVTGLCPASWSNYGVGFPGTNGVPALTAETNPVIGSTLTVDVGNSNPNATVVAIFVGDTQTSIHLRKGGNLLVIPLITLVLPLPAGGMAVEEDIDSDPSLCGLEFFAQTLVIDPGAAKGQAASAGLKLVLGY